MKANAVFSGVSVDDISKARHFYSEVLGFDLTNEKMGVEFQLPGGGVLFIYEKSDHQPALYTFLNIVVADIDKSVDELATKGVVMEKYDNLFPGANQDEKGILRSPDTSQYGPTIAWFKDPAGNTIALIQS